MFTVKDLFRLSRSIIIDSLSGFYGERYYDTGYLDRDAIDRERKRQHVILCKNIQR
jgi:hypothetical protein